MSLWDRDECATGELQPRSCCAVAVTCTALMFKLFYCAKHIRIADLAVERWLDGWMTGWYGMVWYGIVEFNVPLDTV